MILLDNSFIGHDVFNASKRIAVFSLFLLIPSIALSQGQISKFLKPGDKVPTFFFDEVLNSDHTLSDASLKGKPYILEFWATWCGPCIPAMDHLDSLKQKFSDQIEIIAVSDEDIERLNSFIEKKRPNTILVREPDHRDSFFYEAIPYSILVDKNGIVQGTTNPKDITSKTIERLIDGLPLQLPKKEEIRIDGVANELYSNVGDGFFSYLTTHNPEQRRSSFLKWPGETGYKKFEFNNLFLDAIFSEIFQTHLLTQVKLEGFPETVLDKSRLNTEGQYTFYLEVAPDKEDRIHEIAQEEIIKALGVTISQEYEQGEVAILTRIDSEGNLPNKNTEAEIKKAFSSGNHFYGHATTIEDVCRYLANYLRVPVLDQTGLEEAFYNVILKWDTFDPKSFHSELEKNGLKVSKTYGKAPILKVIKQ